MASHIEIVRHWARKTKPRAKGHNVFFEGSTIYSYGYHFPMARHTEARGNRIVLLTTRTYSSSTASHVNMVSRSIPEDVFVFHVAHPDSYPTAQDAEAYATRIGYHAGKAQRARSPHVIDWHTKQAATLILEREAFIGMFGL